MPHAGTYYRDRIAKQMLRDEWRYRPTAWGGSWVRARPSAGTETMPHLIRSAQPGSLKAITAPDGMYLQLATGAATADILAIETCGSLQNAHDKRSRFLASTGSLLLLIPARWLGEQQQVQHGAVHERWRTFGDAITAKPTNDLHVPVARLRVFLFVPDDHLESFAEKIALEPHEYLLPHSAFNNQYHPKMKATLTHAFDRRVWQ